MSEHAFFGSPSGMKALKECPGKLAMCKGLDPVPESEYAKEGTVFHETMERYLGRHLSGSKVIVPPVRQYPEMHLHVQEGLKKAVEYWKKFQAKHTHCRFAIEERVTLDKKRDIWGTADVIFVGTNRKGKVDLLLLDWKYGQGVLVNAEENLQAITYALGAVNTITSNLRPLKYSDIGNILIVVAQLRLENGWSEWVLNGATLRNWEHEIFDIVDRGKSIYDDDRFIIEEYLKAGPHCRFCPANYHGKCSKPTELASNQLMLTAEDHSIEEKIKTLTLDQQVELFLNKSTIEDGLNAIAENLNRMLAAGLTHPKLKLIQRRAHRKWRYSEEVTINRLKKLGLKKPFAQPKLIGITEAESLLGKEKLAKLVKAGVGKTEVVRAEDSREQIEVSEPEEYDE